MGRRTHDGKSCRFLRGIQNARIPGFIHARSRSGNKKGIPIFQSLLLVRPWQRYGIWKRTPTRKGEVVRMPWGDGTGPWGRGPMTGRRMGFCAGYDTPGYASAPGRGFGRGFRRGVGRGYGRGFRRDYYENDYPPEPYYRRPYREPSPEEEKRYLEGVVKDLEAELEDIKARLEELSKEK
jgi:hypothetical protein